MSVSTFRGLLFFLFLWTPLWLSAQETPEIRVEEQSFNFGLISEEKGSVEHSFRFRNSGTAPLVITRVTADCGCTTPSWPEAAIAPGQEGEIRVVFNPVGRAGAFVKHIRVFSNAPTSPLELTISGTVTTLGGNSPHTYAKSIGPMQLSASHLAFPPSMPQAEAVMRLIVNNPVPFPIQVSVLSQPTFVAPMEKSFELRSDEPRELNIALAVPAGTKPGMKLEPLVLEVFTPEIGLREVDSVMIVLPLVDDFLTLPPSQTGTMELRTFVDLGKLAGKMGQTEIEIRNVGEGTLRLHSLSSTNRAVSGTADKQDIAPGETIRMQITVDSQIMSDAGWQSVTTDITIICNDPQAPLRRIKVKAEL